VKLTSDEARAAYYCAAALIRHRQRSGEPIPDWLRRHFGQLDAQIRASQSGQEWDCGAEELSQDKLITAREAAQVLGCSKRQVQRLAGDLDGQIIGGRWLFSSSAVAEYAEGRRRHGL
jgi:excisionase family DNA binding protein